MFVGMGANSAGGGYGIENSLRFRNSASAYLNRTASAAPTDGKKVTLSCWVKRGILTGNYYILQSGAGTGNDNYTGFYFRSDHTLQVSMYSVTPRVTTQVFRDSSAWYHFVVAFDTTQGAADDRCKLYVNGEQVTSFSINGSIPLDTLIAFTKQSQANYIGTASDEGTYFDGYMTEINLIDGQQLAPTEFGQINETTGAWEAIEYTGTYGNNGYYLKGRGTDNSGNGNNWTENNFNTTTSTATTYDIMTDVPTLTDADTANYCTLNPVDMQSQITLSEGNLKARSNTLAAGYKVRGTHQLSGKIYFEGTVGAVGGDIGTLFGIADNSDSVTSFSTTRRNGFYYNATLMRKMVDGAVTNIGTGAPTAGDIIGLAFDLDGNTFSIYKNNVALLTSQAFTNDTGFSPIVDIYRNDATDTGFELNFGQRPFAYTPPTGYLELNTFNLPDSSIVDGSENFVPVTWTANGSDQFISTGFDPDFVWYKSRNQVSDHYLIDSLRSGALNSNNTDVEGGGGGSSNLGTGGFTINAGAASDTEVAWNWKAGGTAVSNTAGTITSSVSANPTAGFSVVTYTGAGSGTPTVGHGLGIAPSLVIHKSLLTANWLVNIGAVVGTEGRFAYLNLTNASDFSPNVFDSTSSVLQLGNTPESNADNAFVAYCFAEVEGYSKIGSYTGNGNADGAFVYTGFRPAYIIIKSSTAAESWEIMDNKRETYNGSTAELRANLSNAETTGNNIDFLSNGFKIRTAAGQWNTSAATYIYMAFAENPFKNSLAR